MSFLYIANLFFLFELELLGESTAGKFASVEKHTPRTTKRETRSGIVRVKSLACARFPTQRKKEYTTFPETASVNLAYNSGDG